MKKGLIIGLTILLCIPMMVVHADMALPVNGTNTNLAESAKSVVMMEVSTGKILYERNADEKLAPASMTKMMSLLLIMEAIEQDVIHLNDMVTVSEHASGMGGSQILLETGEKMSVDDMLRGIAIASANDAVVALAEKIAGSEAEFVNKMNARAKELGLKNTNFKNPHGLDAANHYSSARDMGLIGRELVRHKKILEYSSIYEDYLREDTDRKIWLVNTNKLVRFYDGVDGLKTGYTETAGYCLTATAKKDGMRILTVVMGEPDSKTRNKETTEMLDYAFANYKVQTLLKDNSNIGKTKVRKGKDKYATLIPMEEATILNKKIEKDKKATYEVSIESIEAPIKKGDVVGKMTLLIDGKKIRDIDVTVSSDVEKANYLELFWNQLKDMISGTIGF
ncbi:MAG: D-alanyl-D-alanine carboxypeptidase [Bacilli bacterium]|jgi:D-alanyl-D-alanine carboxypeptidase (penicillin-binding protein 5/6)|nr:D-alanyl-D-alanine carboxypeptidase [Bacilli bacterium]